MPGKWWFALLSFDECPTLDTLVRFENKLLRDRWLERKPDTNTTRRTLTGHEARMMFPDAFAPGKYCVDRWVIEPGKAIQMWTGNKFRYMVYRPRLDCSRYVCSDDDITTD